jgi:hypothetical protein
MTDDIFAERVAKVGRRFMSSTHGSIASTRDFVSKMARFSSVAETLKSKMRVK